MDTIQKIRKCHGGDGYVNLSRTNYSNALERVLAEIETFIESDLIDMHNKDFDLGGALKSIQRLILIGL